MLSKNCDIPTIENKVRSIDSIETGKTPFPTNTIFPLPKNAKPRYDLTLSQESVLYQVCPKMMGKSIQTH